MILAIIIIMGVGLITVFTIMAVMQIKEYYDDRKEGTI